MEFVIFGDPELDRGYWFRYGAGRGIDGRELDVEFRLRRIPLNKAQEIEARYGRKKQIQTGAALVPARERTEGEVTDLMLDKAAFCWTETRGLVVTLGDEDAVAAFSVLDGAHEVGSKIELNGETPESIKRFILSRVLGLVLWIVERVDELEKAVGREEATAAKNS